VQISIVAVVIVRSRRSPQSIVVTNGP